MHMMLNDWTYWLSSMRPDELAWMFLPLFLFDAPRYLIGSLAMWLADWWERLFSTNTDEDTSHVYQPSVCVVIAGLNEAKSLRNGLKRLIGSYPVLEIIVVDDGSTDGMAKVGHSIARDHDNILVLSKPRGGKSSAMNFALPFTKAEVVIVLDADSHLSENAIWEIVQPLADPEVGAVSGNVLVRNAFHNLVTRFQALEYQRSILLGRMLTNRLNLLGIASGAFGAFRRTALEHIKGWDVGPGEDEDITLRLRKVGYRIEFVPNAECWTQAPVKWKVLIKQRRRWEWAVVTFESRKHIDMANIFSAAIRFTDLLLVLERWLFNLFLPIVFWFYFAWFLLSQDATHVCNVFLLYYISYCVMDFLTWLLILNYSTQPKRDFRLGIMVPLMSVYHFIQRCVTTWAIAEEILYRRSFRDGFVPKHVREATWHW